ncbi:MAG: transcriptional regulator, LysR family [Paucimonas sp.]|nr:transcriptional regulator, LysR family [Paucimonas sp.]
MDVRGIRSLVAVAAAGSISRAAEQMHMAQPALSFQIKKMEQELGVSLFERTRKGVVPTVAGSRLLVHGIAILNHLDLAFQEVRDAVNEPSGRVAVGMSQSMASILTVPLALEVVNRWPKIQFQLVEMNTGHIPEYLAKGDIDLGLTFGKEDNVGTQFTHLLDEDLVFVTSEDQMKSVFGERAATVTEIRFADLARFRLAFPTSVTNLRQRIEEFIRAQKIALNIVIEMNTISQLIDVASAGVASAIIPNASVYSVRHPRTSIILPIVAPRMRRSVYLCRHASAPVSIAVSLVRDLVIREVNSMISSGAWPGGSKDSDADSSS